MSAPRGIDQPAVEAWFAANIDGAEPPLEFEMIAGGHSNITYRVVDSGGHEYVLRRPPLHHVLPTAHDMGREHRIISAMGPTPVPVPPALGFCPDEEVNGAPFYVMGFVHGDILHSAGIAREAVPDEAERGRLGQHFIDVLADLHAVDVEEVGLGSLARHEGYIARQLKRWHGQWQQSKTREIPLIDELHDFFLARIPEQGPASVVHGDYRLGNCISAAGRIEAVLDWEICTLGDPMADVGYVMATWPDPGEGPALDTSAPSILAGFPTKKEMLDRYAQRSGRDVSLIDFYTAFSHWKSACIVEGVYARYLGGATGDTDVDISTFKNRVEEAARRSEEAAARLR
jgi:aminoglycoside phosphotransferase (APT) family kinase protein